MSRALIVFGILLPVALVSVVICCLYKPVPTSPLESSFIVTQEGDVYRAYEGLHGDLKFYGSNSSQVIEKAIAATQLGGQISLRTGIYGPFIINKSVSIIGEGVYAVPPKVPIDPDDMPTSVGGTVIEVTQNGLNGITLRGTLTVTLKNLVIQFSCNQTGHGVYCDVKQNQTGLTYSSLDNIIVYGHDAGHYAFYLVNFLHLSGRMLFSFGGPAMYLASDSWLVKYGNAVFDEVYSRVESGLKVDRNIFEFLGTDPSWQLNLIEFRRLQVMDRSLASSTCYSLHMDNCSWINVENTDIEAPTDGRCIRLDNSRYVNVYVHLIFWGEIIHHNTLACGYYGSGWLDHAGYPMTSDGEGDFIHNLTMVGDGRVDGFLQK